MQTSPLGYTIEAQIILALLPCSYTTMQEAQSSVRTIRMPDLAKKLHLGRIQRVVSGELKFGGEDAALKRRALRTLDQCLPEEKVVFVDRARGDTVWWGAHEGFVFGEEAF